VIFDGKISCWPFIEQHRAIFNSVNRQAGTFVTTPIIVTKQVYKQFVFEKVLHAIGEKWPRGNVQEVKHTRSLMESLRFDNYVAYIPVFPL
jgi:hypothetical protein